MKRTILASILLTAMFSLAASHSVFAGGWSGSGSFPTGGGNGGDCWNIDSYMWRIDCAGVSFMYYTMSGTNDLLFYNVAYGSTSSSQHAWISGTCGQSNIQGFWHMGINGQGYSRYGRFPVTTYYTGNYSAWGTWGHWATVNASSISGNGTMKSSSQVGHSIWNNGSSASAQYTGTRATVLDNYNKYRAFMGWGTVGSLPGDLYAFCYGPGMEEQKADYAGQSSIDAGSSDGDVSANGGQYSITFRHQLRKTSASPSSYNPGSAWSTTTQNGNNASGTWTVNSSSWTDVKTDTVSGTLLPGEEKTICEYMTYQNHVSSNSSNTTTATTTNQCRTIRRGISNTITGRVRVKVDGVEKSNNELVELSGSNFTISFEHSLARGDDNANGTVFSQWSTAVSGKDLRNWDVTPRGNAHSGTKELAENSGWQTVVSFDTETFSGTLEPDETKTFCQTLTYQSYFDHPATPTQSTASRCVRVHRPKTSCSDGEVLGVNGGKNKGSISVRKLSTAASSNWMTTGLKNTGDSIVRAWTKPNSRIHFKEEMCEGAELSNQYYSLNQGINYSIDATEGYMSGLTTGGPKSWNNNGIQGASNVGKDIWKDETGLGTRNTYEATTYSPATGNQSTQYEITNAHLGTTFNQRLVWNDLWINDNNHTVNYQHNGTRNASAKAEVYIPYNYRLDPQTSSNNNPYIMPGTNTYTITPTITVSSRKNTPVNGDEVYATKTKQTKYQIISYRVPRTATSGNVYTKNNGYYSAGGNTNLAGVCTRFLNGGATNCRLEDSGEGVYDPGTKTLDPVNINLDEVVPIGTKICTVIAVWPSDSHNLTADITSEDQEWNGLTANENKDQRMWRVSQPTCSNVAKKPNFQAYNSGVYAEDEINTAVSNRTHKTTGGSTLERSYGSWSEFEVVSAAKPTLGLSSGARLWGGITTQLDTSKYCYVSPLTFTNHKCQVGDDRHVGQTGVNKLMASDPENIYNQIITRYTKSDADDAGIGSVGSTTNLQIEGACEYDERNGRYVPKAINGSPYPNFSCLSNGAYYTKVKGNAQTANSTQTVCSGWYCNTYISEMWTSTDGEHSSNTYVTHVKGTLYINQNFHYGNTTDKQNTRYKSISEIPQTIFIAKDIKISSNVDHLDAWLIAENSIDTCYPADGKPVSVDNCNSQLTVTGPVIAKKLYLNRTYGGGSTSVINNNNFNSWITEDSQGAELFKTNPFTYLWSYSQSQRYSQAITTYSKELPTRF